MIKVQKQQGFTLIELVIVVIILGLLGATALPRLISATEDAEEATVEGVAGGFATGVGMVRAQWELEGRPAAVSNVATVTYDTVSVGVDASIGYPTGAGDASKDGGTPDTNSSASEITLADCSELFQRLMQSPPSVTSTFDATTKESTDYYVHANTTTDICFYYLMQTIKSESSAPTDATKGRGFSYEADKGQVSVFQN